MKNRFFKLIVSFFLVIIVSCDEPETVVTNFVHTDGSVTRKIEMRSTQKKFGMSDIQVPFDSTWTISDSCDISEKGDTTWVKRAEKVFTNVEAINLEYKNDSGYNSSLLRHAEFSRKFMWFNTVIRFSETIEKRMKFGYPLKNFMSDDELEWYFNPYSINEARLGGADSLKYKALKDSVEVREEKWLMRCLISEWIGEFSELLGKLPETGLSADTLKAREGLLTGIIDSNENDFDSLWQSGYILREYIGEPLATRYRAEADSALDLLDDRVMGKFSNYSVRMKLPGQLTATNGFSDSSQLIVWPVISEYFMAEDYEMWAESRVPNPWAWAVSGAFLLFVLTGVIVRKIKKG